MRLECGAQDEDDDDAEEVPFIIYIFIFIYIYILYCYPFLLSELGLWCEALRLGQRVKVDWLMRHGFCVVAPTT